MQEAFKACLAFPTEDSKPSAEQNTSRFIDAARKLEIFFLQKQLLLADGNDGSEDIAKLKTRIRARENLIAKYNQKLEEWKKIVEELILWIWISINANESGTRYSMCSSRALNNPIFLS